MYNNLDLCALSVDDIIEEYKILHESHTQLKARAELDAQRIHELKRSLDTSLAAERYLTQELEHFSAEALATCPRAEMRMQQELQEIRDKYRTLQWEHEALQHDYKTKVNETCDLQSKLKSAVRDAESSVAPKINSADEYAARLNTMEQENTELMQKLAEYQDTKVQNMFVVAEKEKTIEILMDQVSCLKENLCVKRDELEEKIQLLESSQEQLVDANAKIALLTTAPDKNDRKGNSLFAEVDDQRQAMKNLLASQKKSYLDMKRIFNESKFEIHRLKRENIAMHTELQTCSTIFCSADKTYQNKQNERIRQLMLQNVKLERNLNETQDRLRELAREKSITWLGSILDFCKRETDELKEQLHSMHILNASLEEQIRNVQQEMARWRFESLKSRCVLIDRENLLTENKIAFKLVQAMEFDIKEAEVQASLPRIVSFTPTSTQTENSSGATVRNNIIVATPLKAVQPEESRRAIINLKCDMQLAENDLEYRQTETVEQSVINIEQQIQYKKKKEFEQFETVTKLEASTKPDMKGSPTKPHLQLIKVKNKQNLLSSESEPDLPVASKPLPKGTPIKFAQLKETVEDAQVPTPVKPLRIATPDRAAAMQDTTNGHIRSILTKTRNLFAEDSQKVVNFSSSAPIVCNLISDVHIPKEFRKENEEPVVDIKPPKKPQNIIRRIVVAPRMPEGYLK